MIMRLHEFYPLSIKRKYRGNDFQNTVRMVCGLAGLKLPKDNEEIHRMIVETLGFSWVMPGEGWERWRTQSGQRGFISL